jgi:hypothetical protein
VIKTYGRDEVAVVDLDDVPLEFTAPGRPVHGSPITADEDVDH